MAKKESFSTFFGVLCLPTLSFSLELGFFGVLLKFCLLVMTAIDMLLLLKYTTLTLYLTKTAFELYLF